MQMAEVEVEIVDGGVDVAVGMVFNISTQQARKRPNPGKWKKLAHMQTPGPDNVLPDRMSLAELREQSLHRLKSKNHSHNPPQPTTTMPSHQMPFVCEIHCGSRDCLPGVREW